MNLPLVGPGFFFGDNFPRAVALGWMNHAPSEFYSPLAKEPCRAAEKPKA
jgi:hypothetical protein